MRHEQADQDSDSTFGGNFAGRGAICPAPLGGGNGSSDRISDLHSVFSR